MLKARVSGEGVLREGVRREREGFKRHRFQTRSTSGDHRISNKRIGILDETKAHIGLSKGIDPQQNQASEGRWTRRLMLSERLMSSVAIAGQQTGSFKVPAFKTTRSGAWRRAAYQHDALVLSNQTTLNFTTVINDFLRPYDAQIESTMVNYGRRILNLLVKTCLALCRTVY